MFERFYACEQHTLDKYMRLRDNAEKLSVADILHAGDKSASWIDDMRSKAAAMNDILSFDAEGNAKIDISGVLVNREPDVYDAIMDTKVVSYSAINRSIYSALDKGAKKVTMYFNTPGGAVAGVEKTRDEIKALSELVEVDAVIGEMCCSAGVWLASGIGKKPRAEHRLSEFGSIGVVMVMYDTKEMLSNFGVKEIVLTNDQSTDKRPDISTQAGQAVYREELNAIYEVFRDNVVEGFGVTAETVDGMRGKVVLAEAAEQLGFMAYKNTQQSPAPAVDNTSQEGNMALQEYLASNPDAQAEFDTALKSATATAVEAVQKNICEILALEGVQVSAAAAKALESGTDAKDYAVERLREEQAKRVDAAKTSPFAAITSQQTPADQAPKADDADPQVDAKEADERAKKNAELLFGGTI